MRKKGFSLCLAAITCVSLLAGCGEKAKESQTADNTSAVQTQEQEAADEQNGEVIQLKFTSWSAGGEQKAVKQALASFEEQNPGIKVEAEFIDNANYTAKINTLMEWIFGAGIWSKRPAFGSEALFGRTGGF